MMGPSPTGSAWPSCSVSIVLTLLCCFLSKALLVSGQRDGQSREGLTIPIGVLLGTGNKEVKSAYRYAQTAYNDRVAIPFKLNSYIDSEDILDPFRLISQVCKRMSSGVFMFFGIKDTMTQNILQSFTKTFNMPYIFPDTAVKTEMLGHDFELHMKPHIAQAIVDMIMVFGWDKIHYVYDSDVGLHNVQLVLSKITAMSEYGYNINVQVLARRIHNIEQAHDELKQLDRMDFELFKVIVFDLSSEVAYRHILRQIPEVGMNKEGYHYLIATLDFANLNMGRYLHGGVNVTGFQLVDLENSLVKKFLKEWRSLNAYTYPEAGTNKISSMAALAVDTVDLITRTLGNMIADNPKIFQSTFRRKEIYNYNETRGIPCTSRPTVPWMHGEAIMKQIKMLDFEGLTGRVKFDFRGHRTEHKLHVYTVGLDHGPIKIGNWTEELGFRSKYDKEEPVIHRITVEGRTKNVTSILVAPFLMEKEQDQKNGNGTPLVGNDRYEGYVYDLAKKVAEIVKYDYVLTEVKDEKYGSFDQETETWNGMVGELVRNEADICIAPLTITYQREKYLDFTKPFMNFGISIMIKKPEIMKPGVFSFMEPLNAWIWMCIVFAYCAVSIGLFLVSRFSPYEWSTTSSQDMENKFHILNALWFAMGALMLQGSDACPRSFSGRMIGTVWWFFVLIIISSYTANLAAFLTIERMQTPIESADDLARQTNIKYGTLISGTTKEFFETSKVATYQQMWTFMSTANPSVFVTKTEDGIERVRKSKGKYAFLMESPANDFANNREPCDTMKVGPNLNSKGFGIATPNKSPLRDKINLAVLELKEDGTLHKLQQKWWNDKGQCSSGMESSGKRELSLSNVAGIFYILVGGLVLAVILASAEFICVKSKLNFKGGMYMKATETASTLVATPTTDRENGGVSDTHPRTYTFDKDQDTFTYGSTPKIGFEHFGNQNDHTDL